MPVVCCRESGAPEEGVAVVGGGREAAGLVGGPGPDGGLRIVFVGRVVDAGGGVEEGCGENWGDTTSGKGGC